MADDADGLTLLPIGAAAPPFALRDAKGRAHSLVALRGSRIVLFFYPKDSSAACSEQARAFEARRLTLRRAGVVLLGISPDTAHAHATFAERQGLRFPLLVDERDEEGTPLTCDRYGVWQRKSMYGRAYMGVVRTTYVIGPDGRVTHRFDAVRVRGHVDAVLAALGLAPAAIRRRPPARATGRSERTGGS